LTVAERTLLQHRSGFGRLLSGVEASVPSFLYRRKGFSHPNDRSIFKVLVVGRSIDRWQRVKLIGHAENYVSAVDFEFEEADVESEISLPAGTDGVLNCGCHLPSDWSLPTVRIGFTNSGDGSDAWVDLGTGQGVGQALAALVCHARGSTSFRFSDDGLEVRVTGDAENGLSVLGMAEASRVVRIIVEDGCNRIGGLWAPLFPRITEISLPICSLSRRTFSGVRFSKIGFRWATTPDPERALDLFADVIEAFDDPPFSATFSWGESVRDLMSNCLPGWNIRPGQFRRFDFTACPQCLSDSAFAHSSLEAVELPDSVVELGKWCFDFCRSLESVRLGTGVRSLPFSVFRGCSSLSRFTASRLERIEERAFYGTRSLRAFDFDCLTSDGFIGAKAFGKSGLSSVDLSGSPARQLCDGVFFECKLLRKAVLSQLKIQRIMFCGCSSLERVSLTAPVNRIGTQAFIGCSALRILDLSALTPDAEIETWAFCYSGLLEVTFPAKLRSIADGAFSYCKSLESISLPRELDFLDGRVFGSCTSLKRLQCGDVGKWKNPEEFFYGGKLSRLELTGKNFDSLPAEAIDNWMAAEGSIISTTFSGRRLGRFVIQRP
jgi:hypothetical protein